MGSGVPVGGCAYPIPAEMRQQEPGIPLLPEPWLHTNNASNLPANVQQQRLLTCTPRHPPGRQITAHTLPPAPLPQACRDDQSKRRRHRGRAEPREGSLPTSAPHLPRVSKLLGATVSDAPDILAGSSQEPTLQMRLQRPRGQGTQKSREVEQGSGLPPGTGSSRARTTDQERGRCRHNADHTPSSRPGDTLPWRQRSVLGAQTRRGDSCRSS